MEMIANWERLRDIRAKLNATLRPYATRAEFEGAVVPDDVDMVFAFDGDQLYRLLRDAAGGWVSADGAVWAATNVASVEEVNAARAAAVGAASTATAAATAAAGSATAAANSQGNVAAAATEATTAAAAAVDAANTAAIDRSTATDAATAAAGSATAAAGSAAAAAGSAAQAASANNYASRTLAVTAATSSTWPVGAVIRDGRVSYRYAGSGTAIADMPGWVPFGTATPLHFGATPGASGDDRPAFVAAKAFVDASGAPLNVPAGEYRFSSALDFGNTPLLLEQGAVIVNASGASEALVYRNGQYVSPLIYDGTNGIYAVSRTERGGRTHFVNGINGTGTVAGPTIEDHSAWYDGAVDNAYSVMQQMDFNYIQYGERKKYLGQRASGTVSLYGGAINVFSVERKSGGSGRSEITPFACGLNFMPDANVAPHYNLYNDYIVSGHANADPYYREGFLAGASYLVQKYTQGNWLDADHDGAYGITIATRPQSGGFAAAPHTTRSWPLRAGLVVAGYSGAQSVTAGDAVGADNGFDRGILIGSGFNGEGGGSVWLPWNGRSRIGYGIHVTDTVTAGILIERIHSGYGIHVKNGGARFEAAYFALTGLPTSASGLASGQLWRDAAAGNVVKIVP